MVDTLDIQNGANLSLVDEAKARAQLQIINNFAIDLINIADEKALAWYVAREVVSKMGFLDCVVYFLDRNDDHLYQVAAIGEKNPVGNEILNALRIPVGKGITGVVAETKAPLLVPDLRQREDYIADLTDESLSELCVPLLFEGELLGVIDSEDTRLNFYTQEDLSFLQSVAALTSARLGMLGKDRALDESRHRTEAVFEASLDAVITFDDQGEILDCNSASRDILQITCDSGCKGSIKTYFSPIIPNTDLDDPNWVETMIEMTGLGIRSERAIRRADKSLTSVEITLVKLREDNQNIFTAFVRDISHQKMIEKERVMALRSAEEANRAKTEFLAVMSHELRTPLNAIIGFADFLTGQFFGPLGSEKYLEYANNIKMSGTHLLGLVNEILDHSATEAKERAFKTERLTFPAAINESIALISVQAERKGVEFKTDLPTECPKLYADRTAVNQILINLLSNAVKFTQSGGEVKLMLKVEDDCHIFTVSDTGYGLPNKNIEDLLAPFTRGDSNAHQAQEGTGLGLAIVKSLVDVHAGILNFESVEGKGTTVTVSLPSRNSGGNV